MKRFFLLSIIATQALGVPAFADDLKGMAVVDMAACVEKYHKSAKEKERLEVLAKEKSTPLQQQRQDIETLGTKLRTLDSRMNDTSFSNSQRTEAREEFERVFKEMRSKQTDLQTALQKVQEEMGAAQDAMAEGILGEIRTVVKELAEAQGLGIVYDRSFLPRSNKAAVYVGPKVIDLTDEVVKKLNGE